MKAIELNPSAPAIPREDKTYWENQIESQKKSQLSKSVYCRANQISYFRFNYWEKKLKKFSHPLIPIKIKSSLHSLNNKPICSITLKNGNDLHIHDKEALILILDRMT